MKLPSLAFLSLSLLAASSAVDAACYRRSRRSLAKRSPSVEGANAGRMQKVQRRQKSGWRMDGQHGNAPAAPSNGSGSPGKNNWSSTSAASFSAGGGNEQQATASPSSSSMTTQPSTQKTKTASSSASKSTSTSTGSSSSSSSSSSSGSTYTGEATYYLQGGVAGNCGTVHSDSDKIIALQTSMYGSGEYCGKAVTIKNTANSKTVTATVADSCPSCSSSSAIDLSQATFEAIGDLDTGVLTVEWSFTD